MKFIIIGNFRIALGRPWDRKSIRHTTVITPQASSTYSSETLSLCLFLKAFYSHPSHHNTHQVRDEERRTENRRELFQQFSNKNKSEQNAIQSVLFGPSLFAALPIVHCIGSCFVPFFSVCCEFSLFADSHFHSISRNVAQKFLGRKTHPQTHTVIKRFSFMQKHTEEGRHV